MDKKEKSNNKYEKYDYKCLLYAPTVALSYEKIVSYPERLGIN